MISPNSVPQLDQLLSAEEENKVDFLGIAKRRKWIIILFILVGLGLSALYFIKAERIYQSSSVILVIDKGLKQRLPVNDTDQSVEQYVGNQTLSTHAMLITSQHLTEKAYNESKLGDLSTIGSPGSIRGGLEIFIGGPGKFEDANVLQITFKNKDPDNCRIVLDAVIKAYRKFLDETYNNASLDKITLITNAKEDLSTSLEIKEKAWQKFREDAPILLRGANGSNPHIERLNLLEEARSNSFIKAAQTRSRIESIKNAIKEGVSREALLLMLKTNSDSVESAAIGNSENRIENQLLPYKVDLAILQEQYGTDHPQVKALEKRMDVMRQFLEQQIAAEEAFSEANKPEKTDFIQVYLKALAQELVEIDFQSQVYSDMYEKERLKVKELEIYETKNEAFAREVEHLTGLFTATLQTLEEINLVRDYGGYETRELTKPSKGGLVSPKLFQTLIIGTLGGFVVGCLFAFLIDIADKSFRSPDEIRKHLGLPIVGHIPAMNFSEIRKAIREEGDTSGPKIDASVVTFHRPKSRQSESYRAIRTSMFFNTQGEDQKIVQVTSPNPGDGKTTLVSNIAVAIAQSGKRMLLIDCDIRRPRLHRIFGCKSDVGLTSALSGEVDLSSAVQDTGVPNLFLLPCGPKPPNPAELLCSSGFAELLDQAREQFDYIIIDTPPLLAVTDASVVAARSDSILLTMRISKHSRPNTLRAVEQLNAVGGKIQGVIVNGVGKGASSYGVGRYAGSQYRYGSYYYQYSDAYMYGDQYARYYTSEEGTPISENPTKET